MAVYQQQWNEAMNSQTGVVEMVLWAGFAPLVLFFHSNSVSDTWMVPFQTRVLGMFISGKNTIRYSLRSIQIIFENRSIKKPPTLVRASDTRTHNGTGGGFRDLYESGINLFISTTAPSTFNIKMISTWAEADRPTCAENGSLFIFIY